MHFTGSRGDDSHPRVCRSGLREGAAVLAAAWMFLVACGAISEPWVGGVRQVDAVILDNTRNVWVDGGNIVTSPYRRLIVVDGERLSSRGLARPPVVLRAEGYTIVVYSYWDEAEAVRTQCYREIETSDQAWLQAWRWQDTVESIPVSQPRQSPND